MNTDIIDAINTGNAHAEAEAHKVKSEREFGPVIPVVDHPNAGFEPAPLRTWVVSRMTMDPHRGDKGFVRLAVKAPTAAIAGTLADAWVSAINAPFCGRSPELIPDYCTIL